VSSATLRTGTIAAMVRLPAVQRWTAALAVVALLLKAAVPMLAGAVAQWRGVPVAALCEVYGVRTVVAGAVVGHDPHAGHVAHADGHAAPAGDVANVDGDRAPSDHGSHRTLAHAGDHCPLNALGPLVGPDAPAGGALGVVRAPAQRAAAKAAPVAYADASARWTARLKQEPPASA
jgi:hypothetical protein